jgi:hypothetical protein
MDSSDEVIQWSNSLKTAGHSWWWGGIASMIRGSGI